MGNKKKAKKPIIYRSSPSSGTPMKISTNLETKIGEPKMNQATCKRQIQMDIRATNERVSVKKKAKITREKDEATSESSDSDSDSESEGTSKNRHTEESKRKTSKEVETDEGDSDGGNEISLEWAKLSSKQRQELMQNLKNVGAVTNSDEDPNSGAGEKEPLEKKRTERETYSSYDGNDITGKKEEKVQSNECLSEHSQRPLGNFVGPSISDGTDNCQPRIHNKNLEIEKGQRTKEITLFSDPLVSNTNKSMDKGGRQDLAYDAQQNEVCSNVNNEEILSTRNDKIEQDKILGAEKKMEKTNEEQDKNNSREKEKGDKDQRAIVANNQKASYKSILMENTQKVGQSSKYRKNRNWNVGFELSKIENQLEEEDDIYISDDEIEDVDEAWGICLVGYIAGVNVGKGAIINCCNSWKVNHKLTFDDSGWVVIKFENEQDRSKVLEGGPYVIFKRPFIIKPMPSLFNFGEDLVTKVPVWVRLPRLPLELWNDKTLSKIGSKIGNPLRTDQLTSSKERKDFARIFVEIDLSKEQIKEVKLKFTNGKEMVQKVNYEFVPLYCKACMAIGHNEHMCMINGKFNSFQYKKPTVQEDRGREKREKEINKPTWIPKVTINQGEKQTNQRTIDSMEEALEIIRDYHRKGKGKIGDANSKNQENITSNLEFQRRKNIAETKSGEISKHGGKRTNNQSMEGKSVKTSMAVRNADGEGQHKEKEYDTDLREVNIQDKDRRIRETTQRDTNNKPKTLMEAMEFVGNSFLSNQVSKEGTHYKGLEIEYQEEIDSEESWSAPKRKSRGQGAVGKRTQ